MAFASDNVFTVVDSEHRGLGDFTADDRQGDLISGSFARSEQFSAVEPLFASLEDVVENQILSLVDSRRAPIDALGLQIVSPQTSQHWRVFDVQFWSDGSGSVRLREPGTVPVIAPPSANGKVGAK